MTDPAPSDREARLLSIIHSAMDAIITVDESQRVILFNPAAERIFGVPAAEAIGSPLDRFIPARFRKAHAAHVRAFGSTGVTMRAMGRLGTLSGLRADGSEFPIEASISQAVAGGQRLYTVILRDVSEKKKLEEQLLQAQKMEGIGRLAGGIAHDFNNLLMAIFNYLTLASNRLEPEHPARAAIASAHEAADRAAALTRQLLTFARKQVVRPRLVSPAEVVSGVTPMLRRMIGDDVALETVLAPDTGTVRADPGQLEQVLVNLVVNAKDAMPAGGRITIASANVHVDQADAHGHVGASPGPHAMITVSDTGSGMPPEVLARLFEPFFTTKEPGKGTGLGLATCHGIVRQSGGHIAVESAPGRGTSIRVYLPRVDGEPAAPGRAAGPAPTVGGSETVLLVEDSPVVRELISDALRRAGYTLLVAPGGPAALRLLETFRGRIDLLVTDVVMPDMGGVELAAKIAARHRGLRIILISGYAEEQVVQEGMETLDAAFLSKPFTTDALLHKIRAVLAG